MMISGVPECFEISPYLNFWNVKDDIAAAQFHVYAGMPCKIWIILFCINVIYENFRNWLKLIEIYQFSYVIKIDKFLIKWDKCCSNLVNSMYSLVTGEYMLYEGPTYVISIGSSSIILEESGIEACGTKTPSRGNRGNKYKM